MRDRLYEVVVSEKTSHGRYGKDAIIGLYIPAPNKAAAVETAKDEIAGLTWDEALSFTRWPYRKKEVFAGVWLHCRIGNVYADRKFSYKAALSKKGTE